MASTEAPPRPHDRHGRRRPFSNWMKRLANLKSSNSDGAHMSQKRVNVAENSKSKKGNASKNNPYPISIRTDNLNGRQSNGHLSFSTPLSSRYTESTGSRTSLPASQDGNVPNGMRSAAPTVSTTGETAASEAAFSKAGTTATAAKTDGGRDSTFSSPAPSVRSLTTTLTTVHSAVTSTLNQAATIGQPTTSAQQSSTFSHPFATSPPATAVPHHLAPHNHPLTYHAAIANNTLTDDASILTLASSTKRRRRNSLDTNASVRALAPQSVWGGSRESLPLSVLSGPEPAGSIHNAPGTLPRSTVAGLASAERASLYSSSDVVPPLASERNSFISGKPGGGGDAASVRSGRHGRTDSASNINGTIVGTSSGSPLIPTPTGASGPLSGRLSRRGSSWGEVPDEENGENANDDDDDTKSDAGRSPEVKHD